MLYYLKKKRENAQILSINPVDYRNSKMFLKMFQILQKEKTCKLFVIFREPLLFKAYRNQQFIF